VYIRGRYARSTVHRRAGQILRLRTSRCYAQDKLTGSQPPASGAGVGSASVILRAWASAVRGRKAGLSIMSKKNAVPPEWIARLEAMRQIRSSGELAREHGTPPHKQVHGEMEIWHYPLGVAGGMLYSIHVAVVGDDASQ